jgi:hypothetical protein
LNLYQQMKHLMASNSKAALLRGEERSISLIN